MLKRAHINENARQEMDKSSDSASYVSSARFSYWIHLRNSARTPFGR